MEVIKVPASVTAPVVAVEGVRPVVPAVNELTPTEEAIFTKSEPSQATAHFSFATIVTPVVGPAPRNTID